MKAVLHYLLLVGIPVLGVLALLRIGERLAAPISVGGNWNLVFSSPDGASPTCSSPVFHLDQPLLTISQSGPHLRLTFNDAENTTLAGDIDGATIIAGAPGHPAATSAPAYQTTAIRFQATVNRQAEPHRLEGSLTMGDCLSIPLTALRQPVARNAAGEH